MNYLLLSLLSVTVGFAAGCCAMAVWLLPSVEEVQEIRTRRFFEAQQRELENVVGKYRR